jgi:hypothetical protein
LLPQAGHFMLPDSTSLRVNSSSKLCPHFLQVNSYSGTALPPPLLARVRVGLGFLGVLQIPITDRAGVGASAGFEAQPGKDHIHQEEPENEKNDKFEHRLASAGRPSRTVNEFRNPAES